MSSEENEKESIEVGRMTQQEDNYGHPDEKTIIEEKSKLKRPPLYQVILHNDDYTTMEFVIMVLQKYFHMDSLVAQNTMLKIHQEGAAVCGVYTYEIAETKRNHVKQSAKDHGHPLECTIEAQ